MASAPRGYVAHFKVDQPAYFFTEADIGKEFVRTSPYRGYDWSYTPSGTTESELRKNALKLVENHHDYLKFQEKDPCNRICGWNYVKLEKNPQKENWNDGNWIPLEKCIRLFATTRSKPLYHLGNSDFWV